MEKKIQITVPEGYTIDREKSTFECIILKRNTVKTWNDYLKIAHGDDIKLKPKVFSNSIILSNQFIKHLEADIKIRILSTYYGGEITKEEWKDNSIHKYALEIFEEKIINSDRWSKYAFLAFHTRKQRDEFIKYNEQLIKDYFMLND